MTFEDSSEGAAYLSSLRRSGSPQAAGTATVRQPVAPRGAETRAESAAPTNKANALRPEKRGTPRYKCTGSARIQEMNGTVLTWAKFADISVHGCYIETPAPYSVGAYIGLKLEVNGFRVEAIGEVRVAYPGVGMGILFTRISEADRGRLRDLVQSVAQSSAALGGARTPSLQKPETLRAVTNPHAVLQAMLTFFEDRHMMGREEFLAIVRKSQ
jgi:hypothetical protein